MMVFHFSSVAFSNTPPGTLDSVDCPMDQHSGYKPVINSCVGFGIDFFKRIAAQDTAKNVFVSPTGAFLALTMLIEGAAGETHKQIGKTLYLVGVSDDSIRDNVKLLQSKLTQSGDAYRFDIANALFADRRVAASFKSEYLVRLGLDFDAKIETLDFKDPKSAKVINAWVEQKTAGKIKDFLTERELAGTILDLIDAVYFKAAWSRTFDAALTMPRGFLTVSGQTKESPFMNQSGTYEYLRTEHFQAVRLPYANHQADMIIFLPDETGSLSEFMHHLNQESWTQWAIAFRRKQGDISLPKWKINYEVNLNDTLKSMGMPFAFDKDKADFSGMLSVKAWVGAAKQKTFIEVNEKGTEAAAVTGIGMVGTAMPAHEEKFHFVADHPFAYAITDHKTGVILFMGTVVDPAY